MLQAQDGTFFGTDLNGNMDRFDQSGNIKWSVGDSPQIATADNGVIGIGGTTYDSNGNATGQLGSEPTLAWSGNSYTDGPVNQVTAPVPDVSTTSCSPFQQHNEAHTKVAVPPCTLTSDDDLGFFPPWDSHDPDPQHQVLGYDPPSAAFPYGGPTAQLDSRRIANSARAKGYTGSNTNFAYGVLTAHELGHFLLQQGH